MTKVVPVSDGKIRCPWALRTPLETTYHDDEWGRPCFDGQKLFEYLILDTFQAGLSWSTILLKREGFRVAFHGFSAEIMAAMSDAELEFLLLNPAIIRNRLKLQAARKNAIAFLQLEEKQGGLTDFIWRNFDHKPIINQFSEQKQIPTKTNQSDKLSKDLIKAGFGFCGSVTTYAFMQAAGVVNDHLLSCHCRAV
jgi:DNA-3-methyladenine glycosylase I